MNILRRLSTHARSPPILVHTTTPIPYPLHRRLFSTSFNSQRQKPNCPYVNCSLFEFRKLTRPETRTMVVNEVGVMGTLLQREIESQMLKMVDARVDAKVAPLTERTEKLETLVYGRGKTYLGRIFHQVKSSVNSAFVDFIVQYLENNLLILISLIICVVVKMVKKIAELQIWNDFRTQEKEAEEATAAAVVDAPQAAAAVVDAPQAAAAVVDAPQAAAAPRA